ncbi:hypothetical protein J2810_004041 [Chryseobacterium rhizosphaerae]|uniref:hypothetical protein n=1 Tax=Chryseobacterium rhizosphaerae TaxID=395937 RepID=UPI002862B68F|nr:hypothetical protein [Chryseobacterium rhizosphaerae]MDR6547955.1 hypothetical protein [Chryseobacterium rhizosphaerae]
MTEELHFIKTNPNIAKINLYNKLCREEENILNFLQTNNTAQLETIKEKVKESVDELTKEELMNIFSWFSHMYSSDPEETKTQLFIHGIDLFYEIPSNDKVQSFQQILSDYEKYSQQPMGYIVNSQNFNQFLIYGIFITALLHKDQENILCDYLKADHQDLYVLAENQLYLKESDIQNSTNLQLYFNDLYDMTKFYKGSIIQL